MHTEERFEFTLPALLNILFRGRGIIAVVTALGLAAGIGYGLVVKPLYSASVQIRPGIVAYTEQGAPLRGGIREDIVHFFESSLYWQDMRQDPLFADLKAAPKVRAEFESSSIQFMPGGDVITLTNLSTDPQRAVAILEAAVGSFNRQGQADTVSSDINLTRRSLSNRMKGITHDIDLVAAKEERAAAEIEKVKGELKLIEYERQKTDLDIKTLAEENAWRRRAAQSTLDEVAFARVRLESAEKMLASVLEAEQGAPAGSPPAGGAADPVGEVLKQTASREQAGRVGDLLVTVNDLSAAIFEGQVKADSLRARIMANELEMARLKLVADLVLAKNEGDIRQKVNDLTIHLVKELPNERSVLQNDLAGEKLKLDVIAPLERVGGVLASNKPVRPRKLRAAGILTVLAFFASLALVFMWEYFQCNREQITRPRRI